MTLCLQTYVGEVDTGPRGVPLLRSMWSRVLAESPHQLVAIVDPDMLVTRACDLRCTIRCW